MNEKTTQLIEQLAQKLGTTVEYLWSILLKQAFVDATTRLIIVICTIILGIILYKTHKSFSKKNSNGYTSYDNKGYFIEIMVISTVLFVVFILGSINCIPYIINGYFNPEYWALCKILEFKG